MQVGDLVRVIVSSCVPPKRRSAAHQDPIDRTGEFGLVVDREFAWMADEDDDTQLVAVLLTKTGRAHTFYDWQLKVISEKDTQTNY